MCGDDSQSTVGGECGEDGLLGLFLCGSGDGILYHINVPAAKVIPSLWLVSWRVGRGGRKKVEDGSAEDERARFQAEKLLILVTVLHTMYLVREYFVEYRFIWS